MKRMLLSVAVAVGLGLSSSADAQAQAPLITEAFVDAETATLTFNGAGFREGFPVVTLGNNELPVRWATEATAATWLPELQPGTYRLIARWPDGAQADFYLTLGAVGPAGPAGSPGPKGDQGPPGFGGVAHFGDAAAEGGVAAATTQPTYNHGNGTDALGRLTTGARRNTAFGWAAGNKITTGSHNTAVGGQALSGSGPHAGFTGTGNTAVGAAAMQHSGRDSYGNTAVGYGALRAARGSNNIGIGRNAGSEYGLPRIGTGNGNIFIGTNARNRTGQNNIYLGSGLYAKPLSEAQEHEPTLGETATIRLGNWATHRYTYLVGQVYYGNPPTELAVAIGNAGASAMRAVEALATRVKALEDAP